MFYGCIDIGGTFSDLVVHSPDSDVQLFKAPTTPGEFEKGFMNVIAIAAQVHQLSTEEFLAQTETMVHGTTVSTNALVEGKLAPVGLICTVGHPDVLTLRESPPKRAFETKIDFPPPYVPRSRTCEVRGRIDAMGNEFVKLRERDVWAAARRLRKCDVKAVAVALLWLIVNPGHGLRILAILEEEFPGIPVTLSHEINPRSPRVPARHRGLHQCLTVSNRQRIRWQTGSGA